MRHVCWLLLLAGLLAPAAQARPRDDVMSGAYRCAAIADSRVWLDCYYGAAQPVRARLALPPAPAVQTALVNAPPGGGAPRDESIRDDVMAGAAGCSRASDERPWLDCYYAAAAPMRARLGLAGGGTKSPPPRPVMASTARAPTVPSGPPPMPRETGLLNGLFNNVRPVVHNVPMQSFSLDRKGAFIVTLSDGEVWKQSDEDEVHHPAHWGAAGPDVLVTIAPDAMHTFTMTVGEQSRIYKVRRIR